MAAAPVSSLHFNLMEAALVEEAVNDAAVSGNLLLLKELASGMDLREFSGYNGRNLLHLAVMKSCATATGRLDFIRYLVEEEGFDVNSTSTEGETTVFVATQTPWVQEVDASDAAGVVPLLTYFLGRGVDPAAPDAKGDTPLHNAAMSGHKEAILLLFSRGVPVDPLSHNGTPLGRAAKEGHAHAVKILLEHGADPNLVANRALSPLVMACISDSLECVKLLVEAGADVHFRPPGSTMLLAAIGSGSADIVNFMLEAGADPNIHNGYGRFPIMAAAFHDRRDIVEILLPRTNPIPSLPDWSIDGIISTMKPLPRDLYGEPIANAKSKGKEASANGDYGYAIYCFQRARCIDPDDATIQANLSLCYLKLREGIQAMRHARECKRLRPRWAKAWFREGAALSLMQNYISAVTSFQEALKLDPGNVEVKNKLRETEEALSKKYHLS